MVRCDSYADDLFDYRSLGILDVFVTRSIRGGCKVGYITGPLLAKVSVFVSVIFGYA